MLTKVSFSQEVTIKGVVKDGKEALPGATILVKGTTNGVSTDFDGNFSIKLAIGETIIVNYLGFTNKEILILENKFYTITLEPNSNELEEIIVVGYGSQKRQF